MERILEGVRKGKVALRGRRQFHVEPTVQTVKPFGSHLLGKIEVDLSKDPKADDTVRLLGGRHACTDVPRRCGSSTWLDCLPFAVDSSSN